jgi:transposase
MGQATPLAIRKEIVSLRQSGKQHSEISRELNVPFATVKYIWGNYKKEGEKGLLTKYANCGVKTIRSEVKMYRVTMWLKRLHSKWGAGRIRIGLQSRYDEKIIPSERTMQRWFRGKKSNKTTSD